MLIEKIKQLAFPAFLGSLAALSFSNSFFEIFSGAYLGLTLIVVLAQKRGDIFKSRVAFFALLYLFVVLVSCAGSGYWGNSLKGIFRALRSVLICFFALVVVDSEKKFKTAYYVMAGTALAIGMDALVQGGLGFDLIRGKSMTPYTQQVGRVTGPFGHANDFSAYLTVVLFLFLGMIPFFFKEEKITKKLFVLSGTVVLGLSFLWTYARGAWMAVAAVFVSMAIVKRNIFLTVCLALAALALFFLSPNAVRRMSSLWEDPHGGTMTERRLLWEESFRMIQERPWLGFGINTYSKVEPQFKSKDHPTDNQYAHNGYLQIAAETGLLGLGSFLLFLFSFFGAAVRSFSGQRANFISEAGVSLCFGIAAFLLHSIIETNLQSLRLVSLLWLSMGLVLCARKLQERAPL